MKDSWLLLTVLAVWAAGCAPQALSPPRLGETRAPALLWEALGRYNAAPTAVRCTGLVREMGQPSANFGATVAAGRGLRFDAVAGPFSTPVFALACVSGVECRSFDPAARKVYVDEGATWEPLLGDLLRGRVPRLSGGIPGGAWETEAGSPVLVVARSDGWEERIDFTASGERPERVFLGRSGAAPDLEIRYGEVGASVDGAAFPSRIEIWTRQPERAYVIVFQRVEPVAQGFDVGLFSMTAPPGATEVHVRGNDAWENPSIPPWVLPFGLPSASTAP